jgi:hypothetical protein
MATLGIEANTPAKPNYKKLAAANFHVWRSSRRQVVAGPTPPANAFV